MPPTRRPKSAKLKAMLSPPPTTESRIKRPQITTGPSGNDSTTAVSINEDYGSETNEMQQIVSALDARMRRKQNSLQKRLQVEFNKRMKKASEMVQTFMENSRNETDKKLEEYAKVVNAYTKKCEKLFETIQESMQDIETSGAELVNMLRVEEVQGFNKELDASITVNQAAVHSGARKNKKRQHQKKSRAELLALINADDSADEDSQ